MKRIISFVLCFSMLISLFPMNAFAAAVDETTPVTEAAQETVTAVSAEAPVAGTTEAVEPTAEETTAAATEAPETTAATAAPEGTEAVPEEVTEAVTEEVTEPAQTQSDETVAEDTYTEFTWVPDVELPSDEERFAGYVDKVLYGTSTFGVMAGSKLTGDTRVAYEGFRDLIQQVAAGELDSAELTVSSGFSGTTIPDNLLNDLFYALLADLPYELYWFDKTMGVSGAYGTSGGQLYITLYFTVSPDYSADGSEGTYDVDTTKTGAAAAAAANAQDIVATYAEVSDYEKLVAYRDEICALTAYNSSAASSSYSGGYGDPWQLIWVFDGLSSTKVVCEGYSKAFQYLCDLSNFDADITCYNVQGTMDGGGHMWNIVSINGSSYLVDVTNSEVGTIGYKDKLFLVGKTPNADGSYTLAGAKFAYDSAAITLWGSGEGSILTLAESNFDPDSLVNAPAADIVATMTQEDFASALASCGGQYSLSDTVIISSDMTIPEVRVEMWDGTILVNEGVTLTVGGGLVLEDESQLIVNGTLANTGWYMEVMGGTLTVNGTISGNPFYINDGTVTNSGTWEIEELSANVLGLDNITLTNVPTVNYVAEPQNTDELIAALALVDQYNPWINLLNLTIDKDVAIPENADINIWESTVTVASGATVTLNRDLIINNGALIVEEGGTLVSNVNLTVNDDQGYGAVATIDGQLISNGQIWVNGGAILNINGSAEAYREIHVGFGSNGATSELNINGSMTTYGYLNIVEVTGALNVNQGGTLTIGGMLFDENGQAYTNGYLQAAGATTVNGTLNVIGGLTLGSGVSAALDIAPTGTLNIPADNMWFDVQDTGILTNEGTVNNDAIINNYGTIQNYGIFNNRSQIRLFGTGTYDSDSGTHSGNEPCDGPTAQLNDFLNDLEDGGGVDLYRNGITLTDDLTISLGEEHVIIRDGAALIVPNGVTLTIDSHVRIEEASIVVEEGGELILNTNLDVVSAGALGCVIVNGHMVINDGSALWLDNGASLEVYGSGVVDVIDDPATQDVGAAIHVGYFAPSGTIIVEGTLNTGGYLNIGAGLLTVREDGTLNILNNETYGCGYLEVWGMAQLRGTVNLDGLMASCNGNENGAFVEGTARIELYGTLNGSDTSTIFINPNASISVAPSGVMTTAGEVKVENMGTLWVDGDVTFSGPAPVTNYGSIHVNHFHDDSDYNACLILDGTMTNFGYLAVSDSGTLFVNGTLNISQTMVEEQGFAGYLNSFGYVIVNGTINNNALMDTDSSDGSGSLQINAGGVVNVRDNIVMCVCDLGSLIIDGTLNVCTGAYMEVYSEVSGSGSWINNGTVHFGVFADGETGTEYAGSCSFSGAYTHGEDAAVEVALYQGEPIAFDLADASEQVLVYSGNDIEAIATVLNADPYIPRVVITDDVTSDADLYLGNNGSLTVAEGVTFTNNADFGNWGELTVYGTLVNNGVLSNAMVLTVQEGAELINNGYIDNYCEDFNGAFTVLGTFTNNGEIEGAYPSGPMTGRELAAAMKAAENGRYYLCAPVTVTGQVTLPEDTILNMGHGGSITVTEGSCLINNAWRTILSGGSAVIVEEGGTYTGNDSTDIREGSTFTVDGHLINNSSIEVWGALYVNGTYEYNEYTEVWIRQILPGVVTGIDTSLIGLEVEAYSEEEIRDAVGMASDYASVFIEIYSVYADDEPVPVQITLNEDLTIPENVYLCMGSNWQDVIQLTLAEGVTLTNNGSLTLLVEGVSLLISENAALVNNGYIYNDGTIIAEGTLTNNGRLLRNAYVTTAEELVDELNNCADYSSVYIYLSSIDLEETTPVSTTLTESVTIPENACLTLGCFPDDTVELILADGVSMTNNSEICLAEGNVTMYIQENASMINNGSFRMDSGTKLILDGKWSGNYAEGSGTITGSNTDLAIGVLTKVQPSFIENPGTAEQAPGLWAGAKTSFYPTLFRIINGEPMDASAVSVSFSEGAENYAKIVQKDGLITVTANSNLTTHEIITITFTAENAEPCIVNMHLRPKAAAANVLLNGETVTGQTILADLNRGDTGFQLTPSGTPADAVPENGTLYSGAELVTWKSSAPAIATVDESGWVSFTGEKTGKVKITMTANYGVKKTAVVTFNVAELPQEIFSSENNPSVLVGGSSGICTAIDAEGNTLKSTAVKWYLSDEQGEAISAHPYAAITAAGKLTARAVADETKVYLMAQVIGDELSAKLSEPVCVTLYPAVGYVQILAGGVDITGQTLSYDVDAAGLTTQLNWAVGPYAESVQSISWKSSKPAVADIDQNGLITVASENASGAVKFTLTVTALNGKKSTAVVTWNFGIFTTELDLAVTLPDGTVTDDLSDLVVTGGQNLSFSGSCVPENVTTDGVVWSVVDKTCGTISSKGVLKTKAVNNPTEFIVIAESKDGYISHKITITLMPKQISTPDGMMDALYIYTDGQEEEYKYLTKTTHTMLAGGDMWLYASDDVTWKSSNTTVAKVSEDGCLTALKDGTSTITATAADGRTAAFTLKVSKLSQYVEITTKKGEPFTVVSGKSLDLVGTVTFSDGSTDKKVTWSMTYPDGTAVPKTVATISTSGKVAAAKGLNAVTRVRVYADAKDGNSYGFEDLTIVPMTTAIEVFGPFGPNGSSADVSNTTQVWDMLSGTEFALSAKVFPSDAMQDVTWKSSSAKIATIDEYGNVKCLKSGTVTVTATAKDGSGKKATFKLTVMKTMEYLELPETAIIGGGKSLTFSKLEGYRVDPLATNQTLNWLLTYPDGSAVPASVATLTKGVLKTKAVTAPVSLFIRAEATDGSGLADDCTVTIFPVIKGVELYNVDGDIVSKKAVTAPINRGYTILPDATNVAGFGYDDDGTMDESVSPDQAWTITYSKAGLVNAEIDGQAITFYGTEAAVGQSVKITLKANDGSGKSAYFTLRFTEASAEVETGTLATVLSQIDVHSSPAIDSEVIGTLYAGDEIEISRRETVMDIDWALITSPETGWITMENVQISG